MAGIPQITNPVATKSYSNLLNNQQREGEAFDIVQLTRPIEVKSATEREAQNQSSLAADRKDLLPLQVKTPKDPTMAVETLKMLINPELLATAKANGYTELYGELEELSRSIYLFPEDLLAEILNQENQTTMFSDERLFNLLRNLAGRAMVAGNEELKSSIGNFLKAVNFAMNKDEILNALSANLRFLSNYFSPSRSLSEHLSGLSGMWGADDSREFFEVLKNETLDLMKNVSDSLLNNEKTQILIPLIIHNLSKYNTNNYMLREYFSVLLTHIPPGMRGELNEAFEDYIRLLIRNEAASQIENAVSRNIEEREFQFLNLLKEKFAVEGWFEKLALTSENITAPAASLLSGEADGAEALMRTLMALADDESMFNALHKDLQEIGSIDKLVNYLNDILKLLPDTNERQLLFETLSEIITVMAEKSELPPETPETPAAPKKQPAGKSALNELTNFIEKNINHAALKSLNSFNASNLLQSLINAPSVFTPLAHYVIPLQIGDTRAFGELWVDNDEKNAAGGGADGRKNYHLFLTFEIETVGRFEADLYASGNDVNLALLYPDGFSDSVKQIKERVSRYISSTGYSVRDFQTGVLKEPHNLVQVFPRILERRVGLDVKI